MNADRAAQLDADERDERDAPGASNASGAPDEIDADDAPTESLEAALPLRRLARSAAHAQAGDHRGARASDASDAGRAQETQDARALDPEFTGDVSVVDVAMVEHDEGDDQWSKLESAYDARNEANAQGKAFEARAGSVGNAAGNNAIDGNAGAAISPKVRTALGLGPNDLSPAQLAAIAQAPQRGAASQAPAFAGVSETAQLQPMGFPSPTAPHVNELSQPAHTPHAAHAMSPHPAHAMAPPANDARAAVSTRTPSQLAQLAAAYPALGPNPFIPPHQSAAPMPGMTPGQGTAGLAAPAFVTPGAPGTTRRTRGADGKSSRFNRAPWFCLGLMVGVAAMVAAFFLPAREAPSATSVQVTPIGQSGQNQDSLVGPQVAQQVAPPQAVQAPTAPPQLSLASPASPPAAPQSQGASGQPQTGAQVAAVGKPVPTVDVRTLPVAGQKVAAPSRRGRPRRVGPTQSSPKAPSAQPQAPADDDKATPASPESVSGDLLLQAL